MSGLYEELSGEIDSLRTAGVSPISGVAVEFVGKAMDCCLEAVGGWLPTVSGQRTNCNACGNMIKAVEAHGNIVVGKVDSLGVNSLEFADDYGPQALIYDRVQWSANDIERDLGERSLRSDAVVDSSRAFRAIQRPASHFDDESIRAVALADGVRAVVGKVLPERKHEKIASRSLLSETQGTCGVETAG